MSFGLGIESISNQPRPMTEDQLKRFLSSEIQNAMFYIDSSENISSSRYRNWEYYRGVMSDLPHLQGQSRVHSSEVSDYIQMMLPSLLRPFTSSDKLWNYTPSDISQTEQAKIIGRYINEIVWRKDNRGDIILNNWAFDACVQKNGIVKVWWDEARTFKDDYYQGMTDAEYLLKSSQMGPDEEVTGYQRTPDPNDPTGVSGLHDMSVRRTINTSHVCVEAIPIEEFIISRDARNLKDGVLKSHRTWEVAGKLIEDGYDPAIVNRLPTYNETRSQLTRPGTAGREQNRQNIGDPSMRKVMIYEGIIRCNYDGNGVRDWYFKAGGQDGGVEILDIEPYQAQIFFCDFCPEPIPHQFVGTCPADRLYELQKVNTVLTRQMLQAQYLANAPQREVVADNILSPDQLNNFAAGASILVKAAGSVTPIATPDISQYALSLIQYFDSKAADRVGVSRSSSGLDPDALQNQSATAANLAWNASMGRVEMIAKIWAYTGMRQLGEAILKTVIAYQDFARAVILDGQMTVVDPRQWQNLSDMEVTVSTGLGTGHRDRDMAFLNQIFGIQQGFLEKLGPANPIVNFSQLSLTAQKIAECGGLSQPEAYFGMAPQGWMPPPPPPPQPHPDVVLKSKTEMARTAQDNQVKMTDIQTKAQLETREQTLEWVLGLIQEHMRASSKQVQDVAKRANGREMPTDYPGTGR